MDERELWRELGQQLRVDAVRASAKAGSGHPTSSMSAADLAAVLLAAHLRYDFDAPHDPANDRLVFSKGHASPLVYGLFRAAGALSEEEFGTYRQFGSRLQGHPTPVLPWVDVATGSLGQGLPIGVGMALAGKRLNRLPFRTWVICGDSEMAEGSMWEAAEHAAFYELDNLDGDRRREPARPARRDDARLGPLVVHAAASRRSAGTRSRSTGTTSRRSTPPTARPRRRPVARRRSSRARSRARGTRRSRTRTAGTARRSPRRRSRSSAAIRNRSRRRQARARRRRTASSRQAVDWPAYEVGAKVSTRKAYGEALAALGGERGDVVVLDGEVSNSTYAELFRDAHPERFVEMYIAEQQMVAAAVGMQVLGWKTYSSTFAAFLSRAYDFVRMARRQPGDR